jgi:hypothetical protein
MFPPLHELLIDNLTRIVFARLDMDRFFHDRIRPTAKRFASTILHTPISCLIQREAHFERVFQTHLARNGGRLAGHRVLVVVRLLWFCLCLICVVADETDERAIS